MTTRQVFLQHLAQTSPEPLMLSVTHAKGSWLFTEGGGQVLDAISGIGVSNVGHCHPAVVDAIKSQADKHLFLMVYGELLHQPQNELALTLAQILPPSLQCFYFVNSGSEAVEGALKLAKRATGRPHVVACHNAYHGSSNGALSAGGGEYFKQGYYPLIPGVKRGIFGSQQLIDLVDSTTAAVLIETVQGEAGVRTACASWWQALRQRCTETGTLLILDEIQCGVGRTGAWWAFEHYDIVPDVLLSAKGLGGGMPIGMFATSRELMACLAETPVLGHITTFGGHPVSCVAAKATIDILTQGDLLDHVSLKANWVKEQLLTHSLVEEVRHMGLMMAVQLESYAQVRKVIDHCLATSPKGLLTDWFLYCDSAFRFAPPLTISMEELEFAVKLLLQALDHAADKMV